MLRPKHVAALEPLLPPRVTRLWQRLLSGAPGMEVRMGARMSDQVSSESSRVLSQLPEKPSALILPADLPTTMLK